MVLSADTFSGRGGAPTYLILVWEQLSLSPVEPHCIWGVSEDFAPLSGFKGKLVFKATAPPPD